MTTYRHVLGEHRLSALGNSARKAAMWKLVMVTFRPTSTRTPPRCGIRPNAPHWGIRPNAPRGGGGADSSPCLTPERMVIERREKRQMKALNKTNLRNTNSAASRGQRLGQGQVEGQNYRFPHCWLPSPTGAALIGAILPDASRGQ